MNVSFIKTGIYTALSCVVFLSVAASARANSCPAVGSSTGCGVQLNITAQSGGVGTSYTIANLGNGNPYDGNDDTVVGITNNTTATVTSITLEASITSNAFGFDGDGACTTLGSGAGFPCGTTGYEGPNMMFSAVTDSGSNEFLTITFTNGLTAGSSTWFSLEGTPDSIAGAGGLTGGTGGSGSGGVMPEPASIILLGTGLLGIGFAVRRNM